jgi:hypothetical protein
MSNGTLAPVIYPAVWNTGEVGAGRDALKFIAQTEYYFRSLRILSFTAGGFPHSILTVLVFTRLLL